jgi:undecaprenyl-phosphate 4-deoxy-4-formamido-L-arabinose transferase
MSATATPENSQDLDVSVIVPTFRSAGHVAETVRRIDEALAASGWKYEIVVVDDASPDGAFDVLRLILPSFRDRLSIVRLASNVGQHLTTIVGVGLSEGACVVTIDDDLQHSPNDIAALVYPVLGDECDIVYGRLARRKSDAWRRVFRVPLGVLYRFLNGTREIPTSFRAIRGSIARSLTVPGAGPVVMDHLLVELTRRIRSVTVEPAEPLRTRTTYSLGKLVLLGLAVIVGSLSRIAMPMLVGGILTIAVSFVFLRPESEKAGAFTWFGGVGFAGSLVGCLLLMRSPKKRSVGVLEKHLRGEASSSPRVAPSGRQDSVNPSAN